MMDQLIAELETAPEGSRGLDGLIGLLVHPEAKLWTPDWWSGGPNEYLRWPDPKPGVAKYEQLLRYTTSLDAAQALKLEGWSWEVGEWAYSAGKIVGEASVYNDPNKPCIDAKGWSGPLALSAAWLRARQAMERAA